MCSRCQRRVGAALKGEAGVQQEARAQPGAYLVGEGEGFAGGVGGWVGGLGHLLGVGSGEGSVICWGGGGEGRAGGGRAVGCVQSG
jgi:hypothetical protein